MGPREADMTARFPRTSTAEEIRREIDQTRCRMDRTVDELQTRLSPRYIADQAVCALKEKANNMKHSMINTIKDHPIPSALMGAGAACLAVCAVRDRLGRKPTAEDARLRSETAAYQQGFITGRDVGMTPSSQRFQGAGCAIGEARIDMRESGGRLGQIKETIRHRAADVGHRVADVGHRVNETASSISHRVRDTASNVGHRVTDTAHTVASRTRDTAVHASARARDTYIEHPIAVVLGALGLGIAAGLAIPASRREDQWFGSTRDELLRKAREAGEETLERGKSAAQAAAQCVKQEAGEAIGAKPAKSAAASPAMASMGASKVATGARESERGGRVAEPDRGAASSTGGDGSVNRTPATSRTSGSPATRGGTELG